MVKAEEELLRAAGHEVVQWQAQNPQGTSGVMTLHNYRLLCANGALFRDGRPCEDCIGTHPWHGLRHRCYRESALQSLPAAGTIAVHSLLGTWRREVSLFLALNEFSRARFVSGGLPPERIHVKPNFVADPGPRTVPNSASPTVLYVGRLVAEKGLGVLLEAWRGGTLIEERAK